MKIRCLLFLTLLPVQLVGKLCFENSTLLQEATLDTQVLVYAFSFTNAGTSPVTIISITPDCGCTTVKMDKSTYSAGESGVIKAAFSIGARVGFDSKTVIVTTNECSGNQYILTMNAEIPAFVSLDPQLLFWQMESQPYSQMITARYGPKYPLTLAVIVEPSGTFLAKATNAIDQKSTNILITPSTALKAPGVVEIMFVFKGEDGRKTQKKAFMRILPEAASANPLSAKVLGSADSR